MCRASLVTFHSHSVFWTTAPGYVGGVPYSFSPDSSVESGVHAHIWGSHLLDGKFPDLFECLRGTLLQTHSMDAPMTVDGVFSGHCLIDDRTALLLLATLLWGSHPAGPKLQTILLFLKERPCLFISIFPVSIIASIYLVYSRYPPNTGWMNEGVKECMDE